LDIRVLLVGDIVGKPGRTILKDVVPPYVEKHGIDFVIANGENAAQGSGITENLFKQIVNSEVDVVTSGDHTWRRREVLPILEKDVRLLRPLNYPPRSVGKGSGIFATRSGHRVGVVTALGRVFMDPVDCPFRAVEQAVREIRSVTPLCFVEIHAEATSEKIAFGWRFDGEVSCVFGTHTHVQTADERVLPGGSAYITDLGMTGPHDSVIGRDKHSVIYKFETSMHAPFDVSTGDVQLCRAKVTVDSETGKARSIERVLLRSVDDI